MDAPKRYYPVNVTLLWLVALGVFFNLYLGIFVFSQRGRGSFQLQPIHMVVGITILILMLARLVMRFTVKRPADATAGHKLLDIIAKIVHYGLYLTVLAVTILGVTFTFTWTGTDWDNNGRADAAIREMYYNDNFTWVNDGVSGERGDKSQ